MRASFHLSSTLALLLTLCALPCFALSVEEEVKLGRSVVAEVRHLGLTPDPALTTIGEALTSVVDRKDLPWHFWVIEETKQYNAFAAPGGFVFITRPYFAKLNADEAAFVLGHEMAHVDLNHISRHIRRSRQANLGKLVLSILTDNTLAWNTAADLGATAYITHYSRALEKEADLSGYRYAELAGYDARAAVTALSKLGRQPNLHPWIANIYSTHPLLSSREDRLAALGDEPADISQPPPPSPAHIRDLTAGLQPLDPPLPVAFRILSPEGGRWENRWRKHFTKLLHQHFLPLGFTVAGDDLMYKPDIGDPLAAARTRQARYLLLVTVVEMQTAAVGQPRLEGIKVAAAAKLTARLLDVATGAETWSGEFSAGETAVDVLPADPEVLYPDSLVGRLAARAAAHIAVSSAKALGAAPASQTEDPAR